MEITNIYKCFTDFTRLRILNLLAMGPLCVCHIQEILGEEQVPTSKQLAYMKNNGILDVQREGQWSIYRISEPINPILEINLQQINKGLNSYPCFSEDLKKREITLIKIRNNGECCPSIVCESLAMDCCS